VTKPRFTANPPGAQHVEQKRIRLWSSQSLPGSFDRDFATRNVRGEHVALDHGAADARNLYDGKTDFEGVAIEGASETLSHDARDTGRLQCFHRNGPAR
jgi:hypothetical protein